MRKIINYFSLSEIILWSVSTALILMSFCVFDKSNVLTLIASLVGVTSLILNAKGNPIGQGLMIVFSILYGIISFGSAYYGEMLTYLGMTAPMALLALIAWVKNPYKGSRAEVSVGKIGKREVVTASILSVFVTAILYCVLDYFNTASMLLSTISVTTSFIAAYLTFKRSPFFALAYAANDIVLIVLWGIASVADLSYVSVLICFTIFFINDIYGFVSWRRMEKRQRL